MAKPDEDCGCDEAASVEEYAALTVAPEDDGTDLAPDPRGNAVRKFTRQLIAPYGKPTGDKRRFAANSLTSRELPIPVKWQRTDSQGHSTSVTVGRIDQIEYADDGVYATGILFDPDPGKMARLAEDCNEAFELLQQKVIGPSVDLDDMEFQELPGEYAVNERPEIEVSRGRISATTLVAIPAFAEARPFAMGEQDADEYAAEIESSEALVASGVNVFAEAMPVARDVEWDALHWLSFASRVEGSTLYDDGERVSFPVADMVDGKLQLIPGAVADAISMLAFRSPEVELPEAAKDVMRARLEQLAVQCDLPMPPWQFQAALVAAGVRDWSPSKADFDNPNFEALTPITIRDGRVYGHLASWKSCHIGFAQCVKAPRSRSNYAHFHVGEIQTSDGPLAVGKITLGGGHADTRLGFQAAAEHYDDAGSAVAAVRAGEDKFGIWVSGVALPGSEDKFASLPLFPLSGDWRRVGGSMELVAALAVNTPGFGIPRAHEAAGQPYALVAAGMVVEYKADPSDETVKADLTKKKKRKKMPWMDDEDEEYSAEAIAYAIQQAQRREARARAYGATIAEGLAALDKARLNEAAFRAASVF